MKAPRICCALFALLALPAGCTAKSDLGETHIIGRYLRDINKATDIVKRASSNPAKYGQDPAYINASKAVTQVQFGACITNCWPGKQIATATTNVACMDAFVAKWFKE
jgi:hypothetical protein